MSWLETIYEDAAYTGHIFILYQERNLECEFGKGRGNVREDQSSSHMLYQEFYNENYRDGATARHNYFNFGVWSGVKKLLTIYNTLNYIHRI